MVRQVHIGAGPKEADLSRRKEEQKQSLLSACTSRKWYQCFSERIFASAGGGGGGGAFKRANYTLTTAAHCPCVGCCMVPVSMGTGEVGRSMQINKCLRAGAASVRCLTCTALERVRERILCGDAMHFKASCQHLAQPLPSIYVHSRVWHRRVANGRYTHTHTHTHTRGRARTQWRWKHEDVKTDSKVCCCWTARRRSRSSGHFSPAYIWHTCAVTQLLCWLSRSADFPTCKLKCFFRVIHPYGRRGINKAYMLNGKCELCSCHSFR